MIWKLGDTWGVELNALLGTKRYTLSLAEDDDDVVIHVLAKPGERVEWECYPPTREFDSGSNYDSGKILLSPGTSLDAVVEEAKRLALAAWGRWVAEHPHQSKPVDMAVYRTFAEQVSNLLATPDEGGFAPEDLSPDDFPILLDHIQDLQKRHQVYRKFAVAVHDMLLAPEHRDHLSGILVLAAVPDLLNELRKRLQT